MLLKNSDPRFLTCSGSPGLSDNAKLNLILFNKDNGRLHFSFIAINYSKLFPSIAVKLILFVEPFINS